MKETPVLHLLLLDRGGQRKEHADSLTDPGRLTGLPIKHIIKASR